MSTATITATIETNEMHNHRTADLSEVLGHTVCDASHGLEAVPAWPARWPTPFPTIPRTSPIPTGYVNYRAARSPSGARSSC